MNTLIIYYSLEGNCQLIAEAIANKLKADVLRLEPQRPYPTKGFKKYFVGGMSVVFKRKPSLKNKEIDLNKYDNIIIGTPVWAGSYAPPINSFINKYSISGKNVAVFLCSGGGNIEKCFENFKNALSDNKFIGEINFIEPLKNNRDEAIKTAEKWAEKLAL